ncbi:FecR family protein [Gaoshiqia sp. Z1-71]|uniref:FecR family protein n=1 Tax=Gaoshiqia hydrogeniformans TaxID=3290090 RepID=UPI003BF7DC1E
MKEYLKNRLEKLNSDALTEQERKEALGMFHQAELEFDLKKELFSQLENDPGYQEGQNTVSGFDRLWKRIENKEKEGKSGVFRLRYAYWAAAILILGFILGNIVHPDTGPVSAGQDWYTAIAPKGSVSETILPDGTVIFLNAGSEMKYTYNARTKTREAFLEGEAWFEVEKSDEIPFIVHTPYYNVRVMGTEFNVKAYPDDQEIITTLEKGSVLIEPGKSFKTNENIVLSPGEQLVFHKQERSLHISPVKPEIYTSWKDNKLIFINMNFANLMTLLERKFGVDIVVADPSLLNYHYDGTIKNETILEVLAILEKTLPIDYEIKDQEIRILRK